MRRRINAPFSPNFEEIVAPYEREHMTRALLEGDPPIEAWRGQRAMPLKKLARLAGIDAARLMNLEREIETPTDDELDRLAKALRAPRDLLAVLPGRKSRRTGDVLDGEDGAC